MNKTLLASITLALCTPASAQGYITTPKGRLTIEGGFYAQLFGSWDNARVQQVDGTHVGARGHTITKIAFRLDNRHYYENSSAMGRTWSNIRLDVSETDFGRLSNTFSQNVIGKQTRVFDSKWTWQSQSGAPLLRPAVWGGAGGMLTFPFRTPWVYSGSKAMLMDYRFSGGVLANGGRWATRYFILDGVPTRGYAVASTVLLSPTLNRCADTGLGIPEATAFMTASASVLGNIATETLHNKLQFRHLSMWTAPRALVVHAIGLDGNRTGVDVGARCQRLYVDFSKPVVLLNMWTGAGGEIVRYWSVPWQPVLADLALYVQAAWVDSRNGAFSLTGASKVTLPSRLPSRVPPRFRSIYRPHNLAATIGLGPWLDNRLFPITQYTVR